MTARPPSFKERVREERRHSVLEAARRLFVAHGYAGTTIDAIAEAAGVGKGTVYLHFATKDDLLIELVTQATDGLRQRIAAIEQEGQPPLEQLAACLRVCARSFLDNHDLIATNLPALRTVITARLGSDLPGHAIQRQIVRIVRLGQQQGFFRADVDAATIGLMVMTLAQIPSSLRELHTAMTGDTDAMLEQAIAVLLHGLIPSPTPASPPAITS